MRAEALVVAREPFPNLVVDGWWDDELLRNVLAEFPDPTDPGWRHYDNSTERKFEGGPHLWGEATIEFYTELERRTPELEQTFGIPGLSMETIGGGYHVIPPGGYLAVHADFNRSPVTRRFRRLNVLVYLNEGWDDPGGHLELWDAERNVVDIAPEFNRTAMFETSSTSWHGHPTAAQHWRRSIAAYFFSDEEPEGYVDEHSTVWHAH